MLEAYYAARGWGADGLPARPTLARLGLEGTVDEHTPVAESPLGSPAGPGEPAGD